MAAAVPARFALTPSLQNTGFLDWTKPENVKLYSKAIEKLDFKFEGKPDQVILLAQAVQNRAEICGFNNTIMTIPDEGGIDRNLITEHGLISYEAIELWAATNVTNRETRAAQDNMMLYQCLFVSISEDVKKKLIPKSDQHKVGDTTIAALYYKGIISTVEVETKATVAFIRTKLINLKDTIKTLDYDIDAFHGYVEQQVTSLASHGKISEDLTVYLFQAYESVPDDDFHKIIKWKHSEYFMGVDDLSSKDLMTYAQKCFDVRATNSDSPWLQKSKQALEFEAMTATMNKTMENLKTDNFKLSKALNAKASINPETKKNGKGRTNSGKYAWKDVPPKTGETLTKDKMGKQYHWCPNHKQWTLHKPSECKKGDGSPTAHVAEAEGEDDDQVDDNSNASANAMASFAAACAIDM